MGDRGVPTNRRFRYKNKKTKKHYYFIETDVEEHFLVFTEQWRFTERQAGQMITTLGGVKQMMEKCIPSNMRLAEWKDWIKQTRLPIPKKVREKPVAVPPKPEKRKRARIKRYEKV